MIVKYLTRGAIYYGQQAQAARVPPPALCCALLLLIFCSTQVRADAAIQDVGAIRQVAERYALQQTARAELEASSITAVAGTIDSRLRLAQCSRALSALSMTPGGGLGRVTIGVRCEGDAPWTLYIPVTVQARVPAMVIRRDLNRGDGVTAGDIEFVDKPFDRIPSHALFSVTQLVNMELTRPVQAGTVLTAGMLKEKQLVTRGQEVVIVAKTAGIEVRMAGVAQENGKAGQLITVRNANSGRDIEGQVQDNGTISVSL